MTPTAVHLHQQSRTLEIRFDDGSHFQLSAEYLRVHSPSAEVRGHGGGVPILVYGKKAVGINHIEAIGHYALKIVFDDGHATGLFTWPYLHELGSQYENYWQAYLQRLADEQQSRESNTAPMLAPYKEI